MRIIISTLICLILLPQSVLAEDIRIQYGVIGTYEGSVGMGRISFGISNALDYGSDLITKIGFCKTSSKFVCVKSEHISFAVPKIISDKTRKWKFDGREFSFKERIFRSIPDGKIVDQTYEWDLSKIDRKDKVFLISRTTKNQDINKVTFLYSENRGLVGYISEDIVFVKSSSHYWLNSNVGFGHESLNTVIPIRSWIDETLEPSYTE